MLNAKKIILVEDDPGLIDIYREIFQRTSFDVEIAKTGTEMLQESVHIKNGVSMKPDLILLDLMKPGAEGVKILETFKTDPQLKNIPIFVLTNYENPDMEKTLKRNLIWPERYLIKANHTPFELIGIIKTYLGSETEKKTRLA
jgi:CheY-like chemotaxis protein